MKNDIHDQVASYYGKTLSSTKDLKTSACCTTESYPDYIKHILSEISDEVMEKYYGCGLTIPHEVKNLSVLDLGSGSGRDCFVLSKLVGKDGSVTGVDMTDEQIEVAKSNIPYHTGKFGYSNVEFKKGAIEELERLGLQKNSFDLVVSNCVINLASDKKAVLKGVFDLLKTGGELYFSDVYADRRVPEELQKDPVLYGECLSGALYWNDFLNLAKATGFTDPRVVSTNPIEIEDDEILNKTGNINFHSVTYRLMKLEGLESDCEDYGQAIRYKGTIPESAHLFKLDDHHIFEKGRIYSVCGNTFKMLNETRFKKHFDFWGDFSTHYGIFEGCGGNAPFSNDKNNSEEAASCC